MKSLLQKFEVNREDYTDKGWDKYLTKVLEKAKDCSYYEIMGVENETVDDRELKKTYLKLAQSLHPDKNKDKPYTNSATELFKLVGNAYETLKDPEKARNYRLTQPEPKKSDTQSTNPKSQTTQTTYTTNIPHDFNFTGFSTFFTAGNVHVKQTKTTTTFGGNTFFQNAAEEDQVIKGDVAASQVIESEAGNIIVKGNVYGEVKSKAGDITVEGFVAGKVKTKAGNNYINSGIKSTGQVETMAGNNYIYGEVQGKYSTKVGKNIINGNAANSSKPQYSTTTTYYF